MSGSTIEPSVGFEFMQDAMFNQALAGEFVPNEDPRLSSHSLAMLAIATMHKGRVTEHDAFVEFSYSPSWSQETTSTVQRDHSGIRQVSLDSDTKHLHIEHIRDETYPELMLMSDEVRDIFLPMGGVAVFLDRKLPATVSGNRFPYVGESGLQLPAIQRYVTSMARDFFNSELV